MIKVKVTKNIIRNGTLFFNLTLKQILSAVFSLVVAFGTYFLLKNSLNIDLLMTIIFFEIAICIGLGIVQIQGMSLFKILKLSFKGVDKRPYYIKGVFNNEKTK